MPQSRSSQVDLSVTSFYHCISRCVRRAFLCGDDTYSGRNFDHRKQWLIARLRLLAEVFAIEVCAFAVMANHFHLVLRVDAERAKGWSDEEVAERYGRLFRQAKVRWDQLDPAAQAKQAALWRERLADLSWVMRSLNEWIARRANREDGCKGRFWEGRFKSQPLLDEGALLTCMAYVDLNPVRAGLASCLEEADFTSIQARLRQAAAAKVRKSKKSEARKQRRASTWALMPFADQAKNTEEETIPMRFADYVALVEWTGKAVLEDASKAGHLENQPSALTRLGLAPEAWLHTMGGHALGGLTALGGAEALEALAARRGLRWVKGQRWARRIGALAA